MVGLYTCDPAKVVSLLQRYFQSVSKVAGFGEVLVS